MFANLICFVLLAQCGSGCGSSAGSRNSAAATAMPFTGWQLGNDTKGNPCHYYYQAGRLTGARDCNGDHLIFDGQQWHRSRETSQSETAQEERKRWCRCSKDCPCFRCDCVAKGQCNPGCGCTQKPRLPREPELPTGVEDAKVGNKGERYTIDGREVTKEEALEIIKVGQLPDDAKKLRLTIIGPKETREPVLADLNGNLKHIANELVVQDYDPDAPLIKSLGFKTDGRPSIYLQQPDGKVLLRKSSYEGPAALAEAIRKADPNYDPNKDPDGKPKPPAPFGEKGISPVLILFGAAILAFFFWRN